MAGAGLDGAVTANDPVPRSHLATKVAGNGHKEEDGSQRDGQRQPSARNLYDEADEGYRQETVDNANHPGDG